MLGGSRAKTGIFESSLQCRKAPLMSNDQVWTLSASVTALSATGPRAHAGIPDPDAAAHRRLDAALEQYTR